MAVTMLACWCDGTSARLVREYPKPVPGPGEILLRVRAAGICDTDLQLAKGYMQFHGVLGHEFVGETGDGQRVAAEINNACRACPTCAEGLPGHCPNRTVLGILGHDGALAEFVAVPERNLHAVPAAVFDREAVFIEPLAAAFQIFEQVDVGSDTRLAELGDGKLGLLCASVAQLTAAQVTLIGKHQEKLALAPPGVRTSLIDELASHSRAFDVVVDCTGSRTGLASALGLVRPRGTVVLKTTIAGPHEINLAPIVIDEIRVIGSRCGPFPKAIAALARREVDVTRLIEAEFRLADVESAFAAAALPGAKKVIVVP
jgi:threonine dehydrogenase-like Zn-dependent dehydrogenase